MEPKWVRVFPRSAIFGQIQLRGGKSIGVLKRRETDPAAVPVPSFYPDHEIIRRNSPCTTIAFCTRTSRWAGFCPAWRKDGLRENTIIFLFSDHGMRLPRHKQFIYEGGHKIPLMISGPATPRS